MALSSVFKTTFNATIALTLNPKHLLVVLLAIYKGMTMGYCWGELTRAYASCVLGVDKVQFVQELMLNERNAIKYQVRFRRLECV